jgi:hypothetical protein
MVTLVTKDLSQSLVPEDAYQPRGLDIGVPHMARVYNYLLSGKDNFAADRKVAERMLEVSPHIPAGIRANRAFLVRTVRYLAGQEGIRQFLDIGTGLPAPDNTHEVAQAVLPESRVVYADNDPLVLTHARALLTSGPRGATTYVDADARDPGKVLAGAADLLDFTQPVAVMLLSILHVIDDEDDPYGIVARLLDPLPPGSFLVISHGATDIEADRMAELAARLGAMMPQSERPVLRDRAQVTRFFAGLEVLEPGVVPIQDWRPDTGTVIDTSIPIGLWGAVGRKGS